MDYKKWPCCGCDSGSLTHFQCARRSGPLLHQRKWSSSRACAGPHFPYGRISIHISVMANIHIYAGYGTYMGLPVYPTLTCHVLLLKLCVLMRIEGCQAPPNLHSLHSLWSGTVPLGSNWWRGGGGVDYLWINDLDHDEVTLSHAEFNHSASQCKTK